MQVAHLLQAGNACLAENRVADAHALFTLALNLDPQNPTGQAKIAQTSMLLGAPNLALAHALQVPWTAAECHDAALIITGAARRLGEEDRAAQAKAALADVPGAEDFLRLFDLSDAFETDEPEGALFDIAEFCAAHPGNVHGEDLFWTCLRKLTKDGDRFDMLLESLGLTYDAPDTARHSTPPRADRSIDIVIPVHNAFDDLQACLASLDHAPSGLLNRIILVDDCSGSETASRLQDLASRNPNLTLVRNAVNLGFTRSVMAGLDVSDAPTVVLLNSDTLVPPGWLDGLWRALHSGPNTALAGPLSNHAYFQTVATKDPVTVHDGAALARLFSRHRYPRVPFLSGFCLMMRRDAHDLVGGLDAEAYPRGYGEVQDLCLRLIDAGYEAVIADDVYVHHAGSRSIAETRRAELLEEGYRRLRDRHSSLRVMTAEALCRMQPEIAYHASSWAQYLQMRDGASAAAPPKMDAGTPRAPMKLWTGRLPQTAQSEVCLFVAHAPLGTLSEYTLHYLSSLRAAGLRIVLCPIVGRLDVPLHPDVLRAADVVVSRLNGGYDFGAWADLLDLMPELWLARRLYFANDSVTGPFSSLEPIIESIRAEDAGFFALSECTNTGYHAQSFFFGWSGANLQAKPLRDFWRGVVAQTDKLRVVLDYEYGIAPLSDSLPDPSRQVVFGMHRVLGGPASEISCINPTHHAWRRMLAAGFPFIKTDLIRDGVPMIDLSDWKDIATRHGADIDAVMRHLETSFLNRQKFDWDRIPTTGD